MPKWARHSRCRQRGSASILNRIRLDPTISVRFDSLYYVGSTISWHSICPRGTREFRARTVTMTKSATAIIDEIPATCGGTRRRMGWLRLLGASDKFSPQFGQMREIEWQREQRLTLSSSTTSTSLRSVRSRSSMMRNRPTLATAVGSSRTSTGCSRNRRLRCDHLGSRKSAEPGPGTHLRLASRSPRRRSRSFSTCHEDSEHRPPRRALGVTERMRPR
jgi:hypothetical protein